MALGVVSPASRGSFFKQVEAASRQKILKCNQCGKCVAGCPAAFTMDLTPRQVIRAVQLGLEEEVLRARSLWVCLYCRTCSVRCPMEIDVDRVMEALRLMAVARGLAPEKKIALFHSIFLGIATRAGRMHELTLGGLFNLRSGQPLANIGRVPGMLRRGKLHFLPPRVKGAAEVKALARRARDIEARHG